ncbi:MAG: hypothetical protein E7331_05860 [Clostridiales bacterium]|nr:hypothetical protein [Clostridiales bacterium]
MKKLTALFIALLMMMTCASAFASGIIFSQNAAPAATATPEPSSLPVFNGVVEYQTMQMDDGLTFILPMDWTTSVPVELLEQGYFFTCTSEENNIIIDGRVEKLPESRTPQQQYEAMKADTAVYMDCLLASNAMDAQVIAFASVDLTEIGCCILKDDRNAVFFTIRHLDGSTLLGDDLTADLAAELSNFVHFSAPAGAQAADPAMGVYNGNFHMPQPEGWITMALNDTELLRMKSPDSSLYFYLRFNHYDNNLTVESIQYSFSTADQISSAEIITNQQGQRMVKADFADGTFSALMIPDDQGNVYIISFTTQDDVPLAEISEYPDLLDLVVENIFVD